MNDLFPGRLRAHFYPSLQVWRSGVADVPCLWFEDEDEDDALLCVRTHDLERFRLAVLIRGEEIVGFYIRPPDDPTLMRQERVEIPIPSRRDD